MLWLCFAFCFLTAFQSSSSRKTGDDEYKGTTWQIKFSVDWLIEGGIYTLRLALASVHNSNLQVWIQKHQWLSFNMIIAILYFNSTNFDGTLSRFVSMMLLQTLPCFRLEWSGEIMQLLGTGFVESIGCLVWTYQLYNSYLGKTPYTWHRRRVRARSKALCTTTFVLKARLT